MPDSGQVKVRVDTSDGYGNLILSRTRPETDIEYKERLLEERERQAAAQAAWMARVHRDIDRARVIVRCFGWSGYRKRWRGFRKRRSLDLRGFLPRD